jgi:Domain of unknown function (DUF397)
MGGNAGWRTATASNPGGNCAEVGTCSSGVHVRDTKQAHLPERDTLKFTAPAWLRFIRQVKTVDWD